VCLFGSAAGACISQGGQRPGFAGSGADNGAAGAGGAAGTRGPVPGRGSGDFVEDHRAECAIPAMPAVSALQDVAPMPDPFTSMSGSAVTTKDQWRCRREEIAAMAEYYELGDKPRYPETVTGAMSGSTLTVTVTDQGKSISFAVTITTPAGSGPFPAVIGYGGGSLGTALSGLPVATINYDNFGLATDGTTHGQGLFYDLYGSSHSAGAIMAWAWGTSRIVDALMATPEAGIDPTHLAVTGCSRNGKGAFVAGVYDQRIALTIPQEGGSGGCSSWRVIAYDKAQGANIEQISNVAGGTNWFRPSFSGTFSSATNKIPYDHHELAGAVAPRALLSIENVIDWLGPDATFANNVATREVFDALGAPDAHTYSLPPAHDHCQLPSSQVHWVQSYVKKYLLGQPGESSAIETPAGYTFDRAKWIDWTTPELQ